MKIRNFCCQFDDRIEVYFLLGINIWVFVLNGLIKTLIDGLIIISCLCDFSDPTGLLVVWDLVLHSLSRSSPHRWNPLATLAAPSHPPTPLIRPTRNPHPHPLRSTKRRRMNLKMLLRRMRTWRMRLVKGGSRLQSRGPDSLPGNPHVRDQADRLRANRSEALPRTTHREAYMEVLKMWQVMLRALGVEGQGSAVPSVVGRHLPFRRSRVKKTQRTWTSLTQAKMMTGILKTWQNWVWKIWRETSQRKRFVQILLTCWRQFDFSKSTV